MDAKVVKEMNLWWATSGTLLLSYRGLSGMPSKQICHMLWCVLWHPVQHLCQFHFVLKILSFICWHNCVMCKWKASWLISAHRKCSCLLFVQVVGNSVLSVFGRYCFFCWSTGLLSRVIFVLACFVFRWEHPCNSSSCRAISTLPRETQESRPNKSTAASEGGSYV